MLKINTFKIIAGFLFVLLSISAFSQDADKEYNETITKADQYFDKGDYINAKASYQFAVKLKPEDPYASQKLKESIDLIKVQMEKSQQYAAKTLIADDLFDEGDLATARKLYVEAVNILPSNPYASDKIDEIDGIMAERERVEKGYNAAITEGDKSFKNESYPEALSAYNKALEFKPDDEYAKRKSTEASGIIDQLKANASEYDNALAIAEQYVERKNYVKAVEQLELAIKLKPEETFPPKRLAEVQKLKKEYESYSKIISDADELYIYKDFEKAKVKYKEALAVQPDDAYVKNMIERIDIALANIDELNATSYELAIKQADEYFSQENYERAMREYQTALTFRPDADYARKQIEEINEVIAFRKSQDEAYKQSIAKADMFFDEKKYEESRKEYLVARDLKPIQQYPKVKIQEIDDIMAALQTQEENYSALVAGADKLFYADDYEESRGQYRKALQLFPDRQYPQDQITMINEIIGLRDTYMKAITEGEKLMLAGDLDAALLEFRNAEKADPDKDYPRDKISEIEKLIVERKEAEALELKYRDAMAVADAYYDNEQWDEAIQAYADARDLKPDERLPGQKIDEVNMILADMAAAVLLWEQYEDMISTADRQYKNEEYEAALRSYQEAAGLQPGEAYPAEKIQQISKLIEAAEAADIINNQYDEVINLADKHFNDEDWENALVHYRASLNLKPGEQYPRDQIDEINRILNEIAVQKQLDEDYTTAVEEGDFLYKEGNLKGALESYTIAANLKPEESLHQKKIDLVSRDIQQEQAIEELEKEYLGLIAEADGYLENEAFDDAINTYNAALQRKPDENYPREQIKEINRIVEERKEQALTQARYDELIAQGDEFFASQSYRQAMLAYEQASETKPDEAYPKSKIEEINGLLAGIAAAKALDDSYIKLIAEADKQLERQKYTEALLSYQSALDLKPAETYPKEKMDEINGILDQIRQSEELQAQYDQLIAQADDLYKADNLSEALSPYQQASALKPDEEYPKTRIEEINGILAAAAELERQYNGFIAEGDKLLAEQNYAEAITNFESALGLKPGEQYPQDKIAEINGIVAQIKANEELQARYDELIIAADSYFNQEEYQRSLSRYQEASGLLPDEAYPKQRIDEINTLLASVAAAEELENNYNSFIREADKLFREENYTDAKTNYTSALGLKPGQQHPQDRIAEIDGILAEQARLAQLETDYNNAIAQGDKSFADQQYEQAITSFTSALELKPEEIYPKDKIAEINGILTALAEAREIQSQYDEAISFADKHKASGDYDNALLEYKRANSIKPDESYAFEQIGVVEGLIAELERTKAIDARYNTAVENGDEFFRTAQYQEALLSYQEAQNEKPGESYPRNQIIKIREALDAQEAERDKVYALAITKADNYYEQQQWEMAKVNYESASEVKPGETYPLDRIKEVNEEILKKRQLLQDDFDKAIADADKFYASKIYDEAIDAYRKAAELFPTEEYPDMMIRKIMKLLSEHSIVQINTSPILIENTNTKKFDFLPVPVQDRKGNYLYFRARNVSDKEHKIIIRYGSGGTMNGGVVVRLPKSDKLNEFIVRISKQDKWFRADNDWLTMYPEGGDVEIGLIQISYAE